MTGRTSVVHVWGMAISIDVRDAVSSLDEVLAPVEAWFELVDELFSTYRPDSTVSRLADGRLAFDDAPRVVRSVIDQCIRLRDETDGYFDAWAGGRLDPTGLVKGWAVDIASDFLLARGVHNHAVNAGGDMRVRGRPAPGRQWRVGIAHPHVHDAVCAAVTVPDGGAVATSGTAERGPHVIDPHTGRAALDLASVTVIGPTLATADAYATAALAMGLQAPRWLEDLPGIDAVVVDAGGYIWRTPGLGAADTLALR